MNSDAYSNFIFNGCSLTFGYGLSDSDKNYAQLVSEYFGAACKNISVPGTDNYSIFVSTLEEIGRSADAWLFVQWTWLNRKSIFMHPSNELGCSFTTHNSPAGIMSLPIGDWLRKQGFTEKDLDTFLKYQTLFTSEYKLCHELFRYVSIISEFAHHKNITPIFVNVGVPEYLTNFLSMEPDVRPSDMPDTIKDLLCFDTTSDETVSRYITTWRDTVRSTNWVNFNDPWNRWSDLALDRSHPGPKAHSGMATKIIKYLDSLCTH